MREVHSIVLNEREVFQAVIDGRRRRRVPLPSGEIQSVLLLEQPELCARYRVVDGDGRIQDLTAHRQELTASVLDYLAGRQVALPEHSTARLMVVRDALVVSFDMTPATAQGAAVSATRH